MSEWPVAELKASPENRIDVVIRQSGVELRETGSGLRGKGALSDRSDSLSVTPEKGHWKDFSTDDRGDVFDWLEKRKGMSFQSACEFLAERAGIELEPLSPEQVAAQNRRHRTIEALEAAWKVIEGHRPPEFEQFIQDRGITPESISLFRIGMAPADLRVRVDSKEFTSDVLMGTGLFREPGRLACSGRVLFPVLVQNRPVNFIGRAVDPAKEPKYLKPKSEHLPDDGLLFGANTVKSGEVLCVVEGPLDVVSCVQAGFPAVALGTASVTEKVKPHLLRLARMASKVVIIPDRDPPGKDGRQAGLEGAKKTADFLWEKGVDCCIADLPHDPAGGKVDADSFIRERGGVSFKEVIENRLLFPEWLLGQIDPDSPEKTGLELFLKALASRDEVYQERLLKAAKAHLRISMETLRARLKKAVKTTARSMKPEKETDLTSRDIPVNVSWSDFLSIVKPILIKASPGENIVLLEGEKRPVRLTRRGEVIVFGSNDEIIHALARVVQDTGCEFVRIGKGGISPTTTPISHFKSLIAKPEEFLIEIKNIVRTATAFQPGFVMPASGIELKSGLFGAFATREMKRYSVQAALEIIQDISGELQFRTQADFANFLAAAITSMVQDALGSARKPGLSINAPQPESGKSVTAALIMAARELPDSQVIIPTTKDGRAAQTSTEELEKRIVAAARKRPAIICVDNADSFSGSDFIEAMLTGSTFEARILGRSESFVLPYVPFFIETKNRGDLRYKKSTLRRFVWITLEPRTALTGCRWKRPTLEDDLRDNTGGIRHLWQDALASLVWAWIDAGQSEFSGEQMNSFNRWSAVIGGILENAGITEFLGNREYQMQFVDPEFEGNFVIMETLWSLFADAPFRAFEVSRDAERFRDAFDARSLEFSEVLPDPTAKSWGRFLSKLVGKTGFPCVLRSVRNREGVNVYQLEPPSGSQEKYGTQQTKDPEAKPVCQGFSRGFLSSGGPCTSMD